MQDKKGQYHGNHHAEFIDRRHREASPAGARDNSTARTNRWRSRTGSGTPASGPDLTDPPAVPVTKTIPHAITSTTAVADSRGKVAVHSRRSRSSPEWRLPPRSTADNSANTIHMEPFPLLWQTFGNPAFFSQTHFAFLTLIIHLKIDAGRKTVVPQSGRKGLWPDNRFSMNPALPNSLYHSAARPDSMRAFVGGATRIFRIFPNDVIIPQRRPTGFYASLCWRRPVKKNRIFPKRRYTIAPPVRILCEPLLAAQSKIFRIFPNDIIPQRRPAGFYASLCWRRSRALSHFS